MLLFRPISSSLSRLKNMVPNFMAADAVLTVFFSDCRPMPAGKIIHCDVGTMYFCTYLVCPFPLAIGFWNIVSLLHSLSSMPRNLAVPHPDTGGSAGSITTGLRHSLVSSLPTVRALVLLYCASVPLVHLKATSDFSWVASSSQCSVTPRDVPHTVIPRLFRLSILISPTSSERAEAGSVTYAVTTEISTECTC